MLNQVFFACPSPASYVSCPSRSRSLNDIEEDRMKPGPESVIRLFQLLALIVLLSFLPPRLDGGACR
jgi:hypothetical protein